MGDTGGSDQLRRSILISSVLTLLLACLLVALVGVVPLYRSLRTVNEERLYSLMRSRSLMIQSFLAEAQSTARHLASRSGLRLALQDLAAGKLTAAAATAAIQANLSDALSVEPRIAGTICLKLDGTEIAQSGIALPAPLLAAHPGGEASAYYPVLVRGQRYLLLRIEIRDAANRTLGWLVMLHEFAGLAAELEEMIYYEEYEDTYVGHLEGDKLRIILMVGATGRVHDGSTDPAVLQALRQACTGKTDLIRFFGENRPPEFVAFAPIRGTDWGICVRESEVSLLQKLHELVERLGLVIIGLAVLGTAVMLLVLRPLAGKLILHALEVEQNLQARTLDLEREKEGLRNLTEELAGANERLETINEELDAFTRTVAHDLRTPLVSIKGFADLGLLQDDGRLAPETRDCLTRVQNAAMRANSLITALLDYARVGRGELHLREVDLSTMAEEIVANLRDQDPARPVEVAIMPGLKAAADANLIYLALQNLLQNAWKYTAQENPARIEFSLEEEGGTRTFCVRDNGVGFDMLLADRLFKPFSRIHSEKDFAGTGVGLSTVKRIIDRHGGRIWVESAVNLGAAFYFTLGDGRPVVSGRYARKP